MSMSPFALVPVRIAALGVALAAVGLSACEPVPDEDAPWIVEADASCDVDGLWWEFWADVSHPAGPREVLWVAMEAAVVLSDDTYDSIYLTELEYQAEGQWAGALESGTTALDCGYPEAYAYFFTAEDSTGNQAYFDFIETPEAAASR